MLIKKGQQALIIFYFIVGLSQMLQFFYRLTNNETIQAYLVVSLKLGIEGRWQVRLYGFPSSLFSTFTVQL